MKIRIGFAALRPNGCAVAVALALCIGAGAPAAYAFGLGEPEVGSALGQPLRMRVPLQPDTDVDLSPQCLHLLGSPHDPLPTLTAAQLTVEEAGATRYLRIDSLNPINEPILRVVIDAGCVRHVQREFSILLDPPVPGAPGGAGLALGAPQFATLSPQGNVNVSPADSTVAAQIGPVSKLDLGVARVQGHIGEPVVLQIPITGSLAPSLEDRDVRVAAIVGSDGSPLPTPARFSLSRSDTSATLLLMTADAVSEPAVRAVVEIATSEASVRREYGVLLDLAPPAPHREEALAPAPKTPSPVEQPPIAAAAPAAPPAKAPEAAPERPAAEAPAPAAPPPKARRAAPKPATPPLAANLPVAPTNAPPAEAGHAPAKAPAAPAKASAAQAKAESHDHLVLSAPDEQTLAAAARLAEMDQRVKDLTQEVVRLRADLVRQQSREQELLAQQGASSGNWLLAVVAVAATGMAAFLLLARRRALTASWNPAQWDDHPMHGLETGYEGAQALTRAGRAAGGAPTRAAPQTAAGAVAAKKTEQGAAAAAGAPDAAHATTAFANTAMGLDPIGGPGTSTKIEVTEVQGSEASIDQLYTLFYDVAANTDPKRGNRDAAPDSGAPTQPAGSGATLDIDLGIPRSARAAQASEPEGTPSTIFTYEERAQDKPAPLAPDLHDAPREAAAGEGSKETEFPRTQPALDLDLTTDLNLHTELGPRTELPRDDAATRPPANSRGAGTLEIDLTTGIGALTQGEPTTEMPREEESAPPALDLEIDTSMLSPEDRKAARSRR